MKVRCQQRGYFTHRKPDLLKNLEKKADFSIFLFILAFLLLNWPFTSITMKENLLYNFIYVFAIWLLIIISLFMIRKNDLTEDKITGDLQKKENKHV